MRPVGPSRSGDRVRRASQHGPLIHEELELSETRKYRKFTAQQKTEIVLASLRGPKTVAELCREHEISESLLRKWRDQFLHELGRISRTGDATDDAKRWAGFYSQHT